MKLLFHCCCGPCASACTGDLADNGITPRLFWYNPNIHPFTEYASRRDSFLQFAAGQKLEFEMIDEYGLRPFLQELYVAPNDSVVEAPARCAHCYRMRMQKAAGFAAQNGFDAFSTSLLASPYQNHDEIRRVCEAAAQQYSVDFFYRDFRPRFREGQNRARGMGLYMQKYCGCVFSEEERYAKKRGTVAS